MITVVKSISYKRAPKIADKIAYFLAYLTFISPIELPIHEVEEYDIPSEIIKHSRPKLTTIT